MHIMKGITYKMVFLSTMTSHRTQEQMNTIPQKRKRRTINNQTWKNAGKVIEMFYGMHT